MSNALHIRQEHVFIKKAIRMTLSRKKHHTTLLCLIYYYCNMKNIYIILYIHIYNICEVHMHTTTQYT